MDSATIIGIFMGLGLIFFGITLLTQDYQMFWSLPSLAIVLGGSLAATLIAFPLHEVGRVFKVIGIVFRKERREMQHLVRQIAELASYARRGPTELEKHFDEVKQPFLKDGIQLVIDGYNDTDIREILTSRIVNREHREKGEVNVVKTMGKLSPAFGMIGTLIGLVVMLYGMSVSDATGDMAAQLGKGMGAAIVTTFYGAILANLFFNPAAAKIDSRIQKASMVQLMLIEGVCLLYNRKHPLIVREKLNSFLPPREWIREEERKG
jgi:chemotaxis protein MotA